MRIGGLWNTPISFQFHKVFKDRFRQMIDADPDATGSALDFLREVDFDRRLAKHEEDDKVFVNEDFIMTMVENYRSIFSSLNPPLKERILEPKITDFAIAMIRCDTAYRSRIFGKIGFIVKNKERFKDPSKNYLEELLMLRDWWIYHDRRERSLRWIDWGFRYIIEHYRADVESNKPINEQFYFQTVNFIFQFIYKNADKWVFRPEDDPNKWFGTEMGAQITELYGGHF